MVLVVRSTQRVSRLRHAIKPTLLYDATDIYAALLKFLHVLIFIILGCCPSVMSFTYHIDQCVTTNKRCVMSKSAKAL